MNRETRIAVSLFMDNDTHCGKRYGMNEGSEGGVRCSECGKAVGNIVNSIVGLRKNQLSPTVITGNRCTLGGRTKVNRNETCKILNIRIDLQETQASERCHGMCR